MITTDHENVSDPKAVIERLLDDEQVLVHLNPRAEGLIIPEHLRANRTVTLRLSRYFKGELHTDDDKIVAELLFGAEYFTCVLPWTSIWGASSLQDEEFIWPDSAPDEILQVALLQQKQSVTDGASRRRKARPIEAYSASRASLEERKARGHLRRVK